MTIGVHNGPMRKLCECSCSPAWSELSCRGVCQPDAAGMSLACRTWQTRWVSCAEQEALQHDADALSAERLARMTGAQLQGMLSRPRPLPAQEQRAALLRQVCLTKALPLASQNLHASWRRGHTAQQVGRGVLLTDGPQSPCPHKVLLPYPSHLRAEFG